VYSTDRKDVDCGTGKYYLEFPRPAGTAASAELPTISVRHFRSTTSLFVGLQAQI
jgi:hypothetical protein